MSQAKSNYQEKQFDLTSFHGKFDFNALYKRLIKMAELKMLWSVLNVLGFTTFAYALLIAFTNVDAVTRAILSILAAIFAVVKIIITSYAARRKHRLEMVEIRKAEREEKERELELRERALQISMAEKKLLQTFKE